MVDEVLARFKNRPGNYIINGLTEIRQRSSIGIAITNTFAYRVHDRFVTKVSDVGDFNTRVQSNTILTDKSGVVREAINMATNAANANAKMYLQQRIESVNAENLANKKASFSFEFLNRGFTDVTINFYYPTVVDNHAVQTLIATKSETFAIDAITKRMKFENVSIPVQAKNGLAIEIVLDGITQAADWDNPLSKFMLNEGPVAASFERAGFSLANEIQLCQRYYEKKYPVNIAPGTPYAFSMSSCFNPTGGVSQDIKTQWYEVSKRATPVVTMYNYVTGATGSWRDTGGVDRTANALHIGEKSFDAQILSIASGQAAYGFWTADCEL